MTIESLQSELSIVLGRSVIKCTVTFIKIFIVYKLFMLWMHCVE